MSDQVFDFIVEMLEKKGSLPDADRLMDYRYLDAGHIGSFEIIRFIMDIEDRFDISLSPEDTQADEFRTVGGLAAMIRQKLA